MIKKIVSCSLLSISLCGCASNQDADDNVDYKPEVNVYGNVGKKVTKYVQVPMKGKGRKKRANGLLLQS